MRITLLSFLLLYAFAADSFVAAGYKDKPISIKSGNLEYRFYEMTEPKRYLNDFESNIVESAREGYRVEQVGEGFTLHKGQSAGESRTRYDQRTNETTRDFHAWTIMSRDTTLPAQQRYEYLIIKGVDPSLDIQKMVKTFQDAAAVGFEFRGMVTDTECTTQEGILLPDCLNAAGLVMERPIGVTKRSVTYGLFDIRAKGLDQPKLSQMFGQGYRPVAKLAGVEIGEKAPPDRRTDYRWLTYGNAIIGEQAKLQATLDRGISPGCHILSPAQLVGCDKDDKTPYAPKVISVERLVNSQRDWQSRIDDGYEIRGVIYISDRPMAILEQSASLKNDRVEVESKVVQIISPVNLSHLKLSEGSGPDYRIDKVMITPMGTLLFVLNRLRQKGHQQSVD